MLALFCARVCEGFFEMPAPKILRDVGIYIRETATHVKEKYFQGSVDKVVRARTSSESVAYTPTHNPTTTRPHTPYKSGGLVVGSVITRPTVDLLEDGGAPKQQFQHTPPQPQSSLHSYIHPQMLAKPPTPVAEALESKAAHVEDDVPFNPAQHQILQELVASGDKDAIIARLRMPLGRGGTVVIRGNVPRGGGVHPASTAVDPGATLKAGSQSFTDLRITITEGAEGAKLQPRHSMSALHDHANTMAPLKRPRQASKGPSPAPSFASQDGRRSVSIQEQEAKHLSADAFFEEYEEAHVIGEAHSAKPTSSNASSAQGYTIGKEEIAPATRIHPDPLQDITVIGKKPISRSPTVERYPAVYAFAGVENSAKKEGVQRTGNKWFATQLKDGHQPSQNVAVTPAMIDALKKSLLTKGYWQEVTNKDKINALTDQVFAVERQSDIRVDTELKPSLRRITSDEDLTGDLTRINNPENPLDLGDGRTKITSAYKDDKGDVYIRMATTRKDETGTTHTQVSWYKAGSSIRNRWVGFGVGILPAVVIGAGLKTYFDKKKAENNADTAEERASTVEGELDLRKKENEDLTTDNNDLKKDNKKKDDTIRDLQDQLRKLQGTGSSSGRTVSTLSAPATTDDRSRDVSALMAPPKPSTQKPAATTRSSVPSAPSRSPINRHA